MSIKYVIQKNFASSVGKKTPKTLQKLIKCENDIIRSGAKVSNKKHPWVHGPMTEFNVSVCLSVPAVVQGFRRGY